MAFLVISFICSGILILLFKVFERQGIPAFQAIVCNYITAAVCGFIFLPNHEEVLSGKFIEQGWLPLAIILGSMFIVVFNLTSITTVRFGVSTATVASKLGLVFPVLLALTFYHEPFNWMKLAGILLAFIAVILSSIKEKSGMANLHISKLKFLPYIVFLSNGACDSFSQFANKRYLMHQGVEEFTFFLFASAGTVGIIILVVQMIRGKLHLNFKSVIGGIALGIPNYVSFLCLLKALAAISWGSSVIFPVSNLGTVAFASLCSFIFFKERISKINLIGLLFALAAIILIVLAGR